MIYRWKCPGIEEDYDTIAAIWLRVHQRTVAKLGGAKEGRTGNVDVAKDGWRLIGTRPVRIGSDAVEQVQ